MHQLLSSHRLTGVFLSCSSIAWHPLVRCECDCNYHQLPDLPRVRCKFQNRWRSLWVMFACSDQLLILRTPTPPQSIRQRTCRGSPCFAMVNIQNGMSDAPCALMCAKYFEVGFAKQSRKSKLCVYPFRLLLAFLVVEMCSTAIVAGSSSWISRFRILAVDFSRWTRVAIMTFSSSSFFTATASAASAASTLVFNLDENALRSAANKTL